ncbi:DHA2 family efflux MFS transporter permease subunit [Candidatus Mycobacterium wuenschmannii]|uniref:DHA2 family efflux MFS transporter permease subunit n=1 Tax=Candidatus Mycobacterium wuenschmannii TaxID=3027808 RepID=A0ABY8VRB1_9MYCO|nr:DHA2 family efflux MFS transporter permease subunit [Candidatus Mycobacterium wuenschmannii]WIM86180.1 DHA2 family efflux MFS transporter permease subunit [Candidatus Mycobacterium wuenschmannii]
MVSSAASPTDTASGADYPDSLDAGLLRIAGVCILASVMAILDGTVVSVAQRTFVAEFGSTQAMVAWTITGYTLGQATVIPLAGWASDRFGTKRLFMGAALWFTLASLMCSLASNISQLIAFRVIQGIGGGMLVPLTLIILTREAGPRRLGRLMAVLGIPMLLAPMCGPVLGGWLISAYGWEWIFRINLPVGAILLVLAASVFPKDQPHPSEAFDFVGMLLLSPGLASLLFGISSVPRHDSFTDNRVWIPGLIGIALIAAFVLHALHRADHPLIDLALFQNRAVTLSNIAMFAFSVGFFGAFLVVPSYLQQLFHETPLQSGLQLIPQGLGAMLTMPLAGTLMDRRGPRNVLLVGIALIAAGLAVFTYGAWQQAEYLPVLMVGLVTMGIGLGCTLTPLSGAAVQTLRPNEVARGSTLLSVNQHVAIAVGTALMSVILTSQFNRSETIGVAEKLGILRGKFTKHGAPAPAHHDVSADFTARLMHDLTQSYTLVLMVSIVIVALTLIPVAFLPNKPPPAGRAEANVPV